MYHANRSDNAVWHQWVAEEEQIWLREIVRQQFWGCSILSMYLSVTTFFILCVLFCSFDDEKKKLS